MNYYLNTVVEHMSFYSATLLTKKELEKEGFDVLTEIDIHEIFKKKLDKGFYNYRILEVMIPSLALKALSAKSKIGSLLTCTIILQERIPREIEISAVDPKKELNSIHNESLLRIADEVSERLLV